MPKHNPPVSAIFSGIVFSDPQIQIADVNQTYSVPFYRDSNGYRSWQLITPTEPSGAWSEIFIQLDADGSHWSADMWAKKPDYALHVFSGTAESLVVSANKSSYGGSCSITPA